MATLSSKTGLPSFSQSITEINYFSDGGFERGTNGVIPGGWVQYVDAAGSTPVDGTGGTPNSSVTMLCSNSGPIRGSLSAIITKDAANRQGIGYSYDFTISPADKGFTSGVSFELQTTSGYVSGDVVFYVYDVSNNILITPRAVSLLKADNYGKFFSDFGLTSGTQYRFILHIATTNASAWQLKLDTMVNTTTKAAVPGADVGSWKPFVPSITGATTSSLTGTFKKLTDSARVRIKADLATISGSISFGFAQIGTLGTHAFPNGQYAYWYDVGHVYDASANKQYIVHAYLATPGIVGIWWENGTTVSNAAGPIVTLTSGDVITLELEIPIQEWANAGSISLANQNTQSPIRAGTIEAFAGSVTPQGWLDCDGTAKLIADYPQLYAQIGATWATCTNTLTGVANSAPAAGSFRVPDLRGAFLRGVGGPNAAGTTTSLAGFQSNKTKTNGIALSGSAPSLGNTSHAHPSHTHALTTSGSDTLVVQAVTAGGINRSIQTATVPGTDLKATTGTPSSLLDTTISGGSYSLGVGDTETRPDNVGVRMIIKAWDESFNLAGFGPATATQQGLILKGRFQTKILPSTVSVTGAVAALTFNNLIPGKAYRISGTVTWTQLASNLQCQLDFYDGTIAGTKVSGGAQVNAVYSSGLTTLEGNMAVNILYIATQTVMTPKWNTGTTNGQLQGNGLRSATFITIEELDIDQTTAFT